MFTQTDSIKGLTAIHRAAQELFDAFGAYWVEHSDSADTREMWTALGVALYGESDPRVIALKPKPKFRVGDWVVIIDGPYSHPGALIVVFAKTGDTIQAHVPEKNRYVSFPESYFRLATPEEIAKARGEC